MPDGDGEVQCLVVAGEGRPAGRRRPVITLVVLFGDGEGAVVW